MQSDSRPDNGSREYLIGKLVISVEAGALLNECRRVLRRYVVLNESQLTVLATWILHTWAFEAAEYTPYLHITAPEKGCGKSRLLEVLEILVRNPERTGGMSAAALMRTVHSDKPTLLLDEVDATFKGNKEVAEGLRGILNEGFRRGGNVRRCVPPNWEVQKFDVFSPKAMAGIGSVPDTVSSRSITIEMRRKLKTERVKTFRMREARIDAIPLIESLLEWSQSEAVEALCNANPSFPEVFTDRQRDVSEPLLALADLAGPGWAEAVRQALSALFSSATSEDTSLGAKLLSDIRSVFCGCHDESLDRISSYELAAALREVEGSPWSDWDRGKGFNANSLAKRLKVFHIYPKTIRLLERTAKGYMKDDFIEDWNRYLPPMSVQAVTPVTKPIALTNYSPFESVTEQYVTDVDFPETVRQPMRVTDVTPLEVEELSSESQRFLHGRI
ncbi:MAG TPA: DUF3631 domain-containing protein [Acidobacteriaceae bacterium]|jgi:hypothetical protein|nr:DUF3631 domain-containing protein [Acidobacteriaceae bacterium]